MIYRCLQNEQHLKTPELCEPTRLLFEAIFAPEHLTVEEVLDAKSKLPNTLHARRATKLMPSSLDMVYQVVQQANAENKRLSPASIYHVWLLSLLLVSLRRRHGHKGGHPTPLAVRVGFKFNVLPAEQSMI
jgi:hypothetical protein